MSAFEYLETHSHHTQSEYPYKAADGSCKAKTGHVKVTTYHKVTPKSSSQLMAAIAKGPVSVSVNASSSAFRSYKSGIVNSTSCGTTTNHAILAVGYGSENGKPYYIVRNSWGSSWGDHGYIKIAAVDGIGICAIQSHPSWPETN